MTKLKPYAPLILLEILCLAILSTTADAGVYSYGVEHNRSEGASWAGAIVYILAIPVLGLLYTYFGDN